MRAVKHARKDSLQMVENMRARKGCKRIKAHSHSNMDEWMKHRKKNSSHQLKTIRLKNTKQRERTEKQKQNAVENA